MIFLTEKEVRLLRDRYPEGCEVELVSMDDIQAPIPGTRGKVQFVDDAGTIHVAWENGSSLGVIYGTDICRRIKQ